MRRLSTHFQEGALCLGRTIRESILWSAYAWRRIVCNWRPKLIASLCRRISFGWRGNGPAWRIKDRTRILRPSADTQTKNPNQRELPSRRAPSRRQAPALRYKMGVDPLAAGSLQGAEQPIAPRMISLTFGHGYCVGGAEFGPVASCGKSVLLCVCYRMWVCIK